MMSFLWSLYKSFRRSAPENDSPVRASPASSIAPSKIIQTPFLKKPSKLKQSLDHSSSKKKQKTSKKLSSSVHAKAESKLASNDSALLENKVVAGKVTKGTAKTGATSRRKASRGSGILAGAQRHLDQLQESDSPRGAEPETRMGNRPATTDEKMNEDGPSMDHGSIIKLEVTPDGHAQIVASRSGEPGPFKKADEIQMPPQQEVPSAGKADLHEWSESETWLANKLMNRGREALLPLELAIDFPSWPDNLFSADPSKTFIKTATAGSSRDLANALQALVNTGISVRSRATAHKNVERDIGRCLRTYHKYIMRDAGLDLKAPTNMPPLICTTIAYPGEATAHVVERNIAELHKAGRKWLKVLVDPRKGVNRRWESSFVKPLPTLYGITVKHGVMGIMTWHSALGPESTGGKPVRPIGMYDWQIKGQDVWHALSVAIVECKAREYLMELKTEGLLGPDRAESDRDA